MCFRQIIHRKKCSLDREETFFWWKFSLEIIQQKDTVNIQGCYNENQGCLEDQVRLHQSCCNSEEKRFSEAAKCMPGPTLLGVAGEAASAAGLLGGWKLDAFTVVKTALRSPLVKKHLLNLGWFALLDRQP